LRNRANVVFAAATKNTDVENPTAADSQTTRSLNIADRSLRGHPAPLGEK
jgi:hypothetical protein